MGDRAAAYNTSTGRSAAAATPAWRKSRRCTPDQQCVEIAPIASEVAVRDSKDPQGPRLLLRPAQWKTFVDGVKTGQYDLG